MVLGGSDIASPGNRWQCLEILMVATVGEWVLSGISWAGAGDVAKPPAMHRTLPPTKNDLAPHVHSTRVEKPGL